MEALTKDPEAANVLVVMTRLPRSGSNKTRLIPALGPDGATAFHDRLARHAVGRAAALAMSHADVRLEVHLEGGSSGEGRDWLGDVDVRVQVEGDLGERIQAAVQGAFDSGARRVVVIGTDCPQLDEASLWNALEALETADLFLIPATDGGYVLIGLSRPIPELFRGIEWGGPRVFEQTIRAADRANVQWVGADPLPDVDLPDDLPQGEQALERGSSLAVIIPTLNEERNIARTLEAVMRSGPEEVIVTDGGSTDRTCELASTGGARVVSSARGRAAQMNAGAAAATSEFLLFLHADTLPPDNYPGIVRAVLTRAGTSAGAFGFKLERPLRWARLIDLLVGVRCRLFSTPYGDQGLFLRRSVFLELSGFPEWPVMEDLHFVRRLRSHGRVVVTGEEALVSARRWRGRGTIRTFVRHQLMLAAYHLGCRPESIARIRSWP